MQTPKVIVIPMKIKTGNQIEIFILIIWVGKWIYPGKRVNEITLLVSKNMDKNFFNLKWRHTTEIDLRADVKTSTMTRTGKKQTRRRYATYFTMNGDCNLQQRNKTESYLCVKHFGKN